MPFSLSGNHSSRFIHPHEEMGPWGRQVEWRECLVQLLLYCSFPVSLLQVSWENPHRHTLEKLRYHPAATAVKVRPGNWSLPMSFRQYRTADFYSLTTTSKRELTYLCHLITEYRGNAEAIYVNYSLFTENHHCSDVCH